MISTKMLRNAGIAFAVIVMAVTFVFANGANAKSKSLVNVLYSGSTYTDTVIDYTKNRTNDKGGKSETRQNAGTKVKRGTTTFKVDGKTYSCPIYSQARKSEFDYERNIRCAPKSVITDTKGAFIIRYDIQADAPTIAGFGEPVYNKTTKRVNNSHSIKINEYKYAQRKKRHRRNQTVYSFFNPKVTSSVTKDKVIITVKVMQKKTRTTIDEGFRSGYKKVETCNFENTATITYTRK